MASLEFGFVEQRTRWRNAEGNFVLGCSNAGKEAMDLVAQCSRLLGRQPLPATGETGKSGTIVRWQESFTLCVLRP
jgi:hypothetical protein